MNKQNKTNRQNKIYKYNNNNLQEIAERIASLSGSNKVEKTSKGYQVCCPCHNDSTPSLSVFFDENDPNQLVCNCFAGCNNQRVYETIRHCIADFEIETDTKGFSKKFFTKGDTFNNQEIKEVYNYTNSNGKILYQRLQLENKIVSFPTRISNSIRTLYNFKELWAKKSHYPNSLERTEYQSTNEIDIANDYYKQWTYWTLTYYDNETKKAKKQPCDIQGKIIKWSKENWTDTFPMRYSEMQEPTSTNIEKGFFLLETDPFVFVDYDDVLKEGDIPKEWTITLGEHLNLNIEDIKAIYCEISQSGKGLHFIIELVDPFLKLKLRQVSGEEAQQKNLFEVYIKDKFVALTSQRILPKIFLECKPNTIFICEDEAECLTLSKIIPSMTTTTCGVLVSKPSEWLDTYSIALDKSNLVILCTPKGESSGRMIATRLLENKKKYKLELKGIKVVVFDELEPLQKVSDYLSEHSLKDFANKIKNTKEYTIQKSEVVTCEDTFSIEDKKPKQFDLDTRGNANRIAYYSNNMLKNILTERGEEFAIYNETKGVWEFSTSQAIAYAQNILRKIPQESIFYSDSKEVSKLLSWAKQSQKPCITKEALTTCNGIKHMTIEKNAFDEHSKKSGKYFVNCLNGTIDLQTGMLLGHKKEHMLTQQIKLNYNPSADYSLWDKCLMDCFENNRELVEFFKIYVGYILTGNPKEKTFCILYGDSGDTGKSTILEALKNTLGDDYSGEIPFSEIAVSRESNQGKAQPYLARVKNCRLVTISETVTSENKRTALDYELVKTWSGNETLPIRDLYSKAESFEPKFTLMIALNNKPKISDYKSSTWDRMILLPFEHKFYGAEKDPNMGAKLFDIREGILAWCIEGAIQYLRLGHLPQNQTIKDCVKQYQREENPVLDWLETYYIYSNEDNTKVNYKELRTLYTELYLKQNNYNLDIASKHSSFAFKRLNQVLKSKGLKVTNEYVYGIIPNKEAIKKALEEAPKQQNEELIELKEIVN